jgi:uncharacterized protein YaiL (DUF2058 family)
VEGRRDKMSEREKRENEKKESWAYVKKLERGKRMARLDGREN